MRTADLTRAALVSLPLVALALVVPGVVVGPVAARDEAPPAPPPTLAATGFDTAERQPFTPQYPLWSDGLSKRRWIALPPGATIDVSDPDRWELPVGTKLWKELALAGTKIETRFLWRARADRWVFATYVWDAAQAGAALAPAEGVRAAAPLGPGKAHDIPSVDDCHACHDTGPSTVLGFNALQLSDDRDPLAPHAEALHPDMLTLATLVAEDRLAPPRPDWVAAPPRVAARTPIERAALGYLAANCGGCHDSRGELGHIGMHLAHASDVEPGVAPPALATTLDARGRWLVPGVAPDDSRVIAPGAPERSALYQRMRSRRPLSQMPPLGTVLPDEAALRLLADWIAQGLARPAAPAELP